MSPVEAATILREREFPKKYLVGEAGTSKMPRKHQLALHCPIYGTNSHMQLCKLERIKIANSGPQF